MPSPGPLRSPPTAAGRGLPDPRIVDRVAGRLAELPAEVARAAFGGAVLSLAGLAVLIAIGLVWMTWMHTESGLSTVEGFASDRVVVFITIVVVGVCAGAWVDERYLRREPLIGEPTEAEADLRQLGLRFVFLIPHLMLQSVWLVRDAVLLNASSIDVELAARLLGACRRGASHDALAEVHSDARARRVALAALAHAGWLGTSRDDRVVLTIEGVRTLEGR